MPEVVFKVLCSNDKDACDRVKTIMSDFAITPNVAGIDYDHIGTKHFDTLLDAHMRANEIAKSAGPHLVDIKIRVK